MSTFPREGDARCTDCGHHPSLVASAAAPLTRDGELRDRLKKLLLDMEQDCDARSWAQDIEALMKETSDEG